MSEYRRIFDSSNRAWEPNPGLNMAYIRACEDYCNYLLREKGRLSLNDVLKQLGFDVDEDKTDPYWHVGWYCDSTHGYGYIQFGIFPNGSWYSNAFILEFNVDGEIQL